MLPELYTNKTISDFKILKLKLNVSAIEHDVVKNLETFLTTSNKRV